MRKAPGSAAGAARDPRRRNAGAIGHWSWFADFDVLLTPVVARQAPPAGWADGRGYLSTYLDAARSITYTQPWNLAGLAAISVPVGRDGKRALSAQLVAPTEALVLQAAADLEQRAVHAAGQSGGWLVFNPGWPTGWLSRVRRPSEGREAVRPRGSASDRRTGSTGPGRLVPDPCDSGGTVRLGSSLVCGGRHRGRALEDTRSSSVTNSRASSTADLAPAKQSRSIPPYHAASARPAERESSPVSHGGLRRTWDERRCAARVPCLADGVAAPVAAAADRRRRRDARAARRGGARHRPRPHPSRLGRRGRGVRTDRADAAPGHPCGGRNDGDRGRAVGPSARSGSAAGRGRGPFAGRGPRAGPDAAGGTRRGRGVRDRGH